MKENSVIIAGGGSPETAMAVVEMLKGIKNKTFEKEPYILEAPYQFSGELLDYKDGKQKRRERRKIERKLKNRR